MNIEDINNELKIYINEASFISDKVLKKMIKLVNKYFYVNLPVDNFFKMNIEILENGNVKAKDEEYFSNNKPLNYDELVNRYYKLKKDIEILLDKKEINFDNKRIKNDKVNFYVTLLFSLILIIIIFYGIKRILNGNIIGGIWIFLVLIPIIIPKIKERYISALRYLKNIFKKK